VILARVHTGWSSSTLERKEKGRRRKEGERREEERKGRWEGN